MPAASSTRGISPGTWGGVSGTGSPHGAHRLSGLSSITNEDLQHMSTAGTISHKWLEVIINFLSGFRNDTADFSKPHLRPAIEGTWVLFVAMYAVLVVLGLLLNGLALARLCRLARARSNKNRGTVRLLANACAANIFQCGVVVPLSVVVLLIQNWVFGPVMCYVLPMLQDVPLHVVMLTFSAISYDRCRFHKNPAAEPFSANVTACCIWIVSSLIVLPYPAFTSYLDLGSLMREQFHGVGICFLNLAEDMQTYICVAFAGVFIIPILLSVLFHGRVHLMLKRQALSGASRVRMYEERLRAASLSTADPRFPSAGQLYTLSGRSGPRHSVTCPSRAGSIQLEAEEDLHREQRTQRFLVAMNLAFALCLLPLMVLRMVKHVVQETYSNSGHFDILFCLFVWLAFLPAVIVPVLVAVWTATLPTWTGRLQEWLCPSHAAKLASSVNVNGGALDHPLHPLHPLPLSLPPPRCPASPIHGLAVLGGPRGSRGSGVGLAMAMHPSPDVVPDAGTNISL